MNFQDVVFCWNDGEFKVCLGPDKHVPIDDSFLFTVTPNDLKRNCLSLNLPRTSGLTLPVFKEFNSCGKSDQLDVHLNFDKIG
jgi:hypothetical protein